MPFTPNEAGWWEIVRQVVNTEGVRRMKLVADACNEELDTDGYMVGVEGTDTLQKHDQRMTVITATAEAIIDNGRNQSLLKNFHLAGGAVP